MIRLFSFTLLILIKPLNADSIFYNTPNSFGGLGLVNTPSARFYDEGSLSLSYYDGYPDKKLSLAIYPYDWMEAIVFYSSFENLEYGGGFYEQDRKDKGFNIKFRIKEEDNWPAIALGFNDLGGTGYYSSEYIVSSYSIGNFDLNFGIGWGHLNGHDHFRNPFTLITDNFNDRINDLDLGGKFNLKSLFSGKKASFFGGINYVYSDKVFFNLEYDTISDNEKIRYKSKESDYSFGINFQPNSKLTFGLNYERGSNISLNISSRRNLLNDHTKFKSLKIKSKNRYENLRRILALNNIGVSKISKENDQLHLEITQYQFSTFNKLDSVVSSSIEESEVKEVVVKSYGIAGLKVIEPNSKVEYEDNIYTRKDKGLNQAFSLNIRPFLASREEFFKGALLLEHDSEIILGKGLFFSTNLKISLADNFDDLRYPPVDTYPAQVRSDIKQYLNNLGENISIGRAQLEYFKTTSKNNHFLVSLGIYEDMFSGYGFEYLNYSYDKQFSWGFDVHKAYKRDYEFGLGLLDFQNTTYHLNLFYRNERVIPFDIKASVGEYLAGDKGITIELSRRFNNGVEFGVFSTFTDVSFDKFGEGSFDKGIFLKIPFGQNYSSLSNFIWRPLTKDPGSKLIRKNDLYSLVNKFRKVN